MIALVPLAAGQAVLMVETPWMPGDDTYVIPRGTTYVDPATGQEAVPLFVPEGSTARDYAAGEKVELVNGAKQPRL